MKSLRVLLIDDNHNMRKIVAAILKGVGIREVYEADDGTHGLQAIRKWGFDLAIVDFRMSPMDGVQFTKLVRNDPSSANPYLPIVMMTGFAEQTRVFEARDAGVTEFLVKPVTAQRVIDRLNAVIYNPRPFVRTDTYFGPQRRGIDDIRSAPVRTPEFFEI